MTGGAFGSLIAQWMKQLTRSARRGWSQGVRGHVGSVRGTIGGNLAGGELLLFELRPRSLVPVAGKRSCRGASGSLAGADRCSPRPQDRRKTAQPC
jgi:hypothetical protein